MSRTLVMGILNITPDSFADGGKYLSKEDAIKQGRRLIAEGADIIDAVSYTHLTLPTIYSV